MPHSGSGRWCNRDRVAQCGYDMEERDGEMERKAGQDGLLSILGTTGWERGSIYTMFTSFPSVDPSSTWPYIVIFHSVKCTYTFPNHEVNSLRAGIMGLIFLRVLRSHCQPSWQSGPH